MHKIKELSGFTLGLFSLLFTSCIDVGLGSAIDLTPPTVSISSHKDNEVVPNAFTLSGSAFDNRELASITISCESHNLYYRVYPGENWYKKNTSTQDEWVLVENSEGSCVQDEKKNWNWSIFIRMSEGDDNSSSANFNLNASVTDKLNNSGKESTVECSLLLDNENPSVTIYKPELLVGSYDAIETETSTYSLRDGNIISKLFNGDITLIGRQSGSISFKELRIDFDDGKLTSGTRKVTGDADPQSSVDELAETVQFDEDEPTVYFSKTLKAGTDNITDLRNWELTVAQSDWVDAVSKNTDLYELGEETGSGKLIRIVTTTLSDSLAWERQIIGWFVWWPEADKPWITLYSGDDEDNGEDTYQIYPASNFSGIVQDDDGIASLTYKLEKYNSAHNWEEYTEEQEITLSDENSTYSAFSIKTPSENGKYRIILKGTDVNGVTVTREKYFTTLDVTPPKINLETPENNSSVLLDQDGNITFKGVVSDDGTVNSLSLIYLNPIANEDASNIIRYMSGNELEWDRATFDGVESSDYSFTNGLATVTYKNSLYKIELSYEGYDSDTKNNYYSFEKTFNIFTDLGINPETKPLLTQYFVLRAVDDGNTKTVNQIVLNGDKEIPVIEVKTIQQFASDDTPKIEEFDFTTNSSVPTFDVVDNDDYAILTGTWYDNSVVAWDNDKSKLSPLSITWVTSSCEIIEENLNDDGSWSWKAKLTNLPKSSRSLTVCLTDLANNTRTVTKSIFVETASKGIVSIGAISDDGSYNAGKTIKIAVYFRKNTKVDCTSGTPTLILNNGAYATYTTGGEEVSPSSVHVFEYTVSESDEDTDGNLDVVSLSVNGAVYKDVSTGTNLDASNLSLPTEDEKKLGTSRNIKVDKTSPLVERARVISTSGYYNAGKNISIVLSFNENVTIAGAENLGLEFENISSPTITSESSGSNVIMTYTVGAGENTNLLKISSITGTESVTVKDEAGNILTDWNVASDLNTDIVIDTTVPVAPTISGAWGSQKLISSGTSFTITGTENDATVEYSIDNGNNWLKYSSSVSLKNSGTYFVKARQTDVAGNVSPVASSNSITIEKGEFLNKITASTASGTYSKGKSIVGKLVFRKDITLPSGAYVTLNALNESGVAYTCLLTKAGSSTITGGCDYTFTYNVVEGDYIPGEAALDVTGWSFDSVTYSTGIEEVGDLTYSLVYSSAVTSDNGKALADNKVIKILTGVPSIDSVSLSGTALTITFDRAVSKGTGTISLALNGDSYSDSYIAPAVLAVSDYSSAFADYYTAGLNGATLNSDSTLTNDTTTKYVLNFAIEPTNSTLIDLFKTEGRNKLEIPIVANSVAVNDKVVTVNLGTTYEIPILGAKYKITVPAGAFSDIVQNKNAEYVASVTSSGVEAPVIRVNKGSQTITPGTSPNYTTGSSVTMPATASVRIDCQTPGATIKYGKEETTPSAVYVINSNQVYNTVTAGATVPSASISYTSSFTLGSAISSYDGATGLKIAITATSTKGTATATSYEYATRTVLKLNITGNYNTWNGDYSTTSAITENGSALTFGKLKVWVVGGTSTSGGNSIDPFPLSWSDSSNFKLMKSDTGFTSSGMKSEWYWVSWDITTKTYHGFVIGDVPSDAAIEGPSQWYSAEGGWDPQKMNYPLYPGETLIMCVSGSVTYTNGNFHWVLKNHATR